jgi:hypothetical protein
MSANAGSLIAAVDRYPTIRSAGLLILLLGLTTLAAAVTAQTETGTAVMSGLFWPGLAISIAAQVIFRHRLSYGKRTVTQTRGLRLGMVLLAVGLGTAAIGLRSASSRTLWLVVLLVVGVHFLPMWVAHGWRIVALGVVCTTMAVIGLAVPTLPFLVIATVDAGAKILTGTAMLAERPTTSAQPAL